MYGGVEKVTARKSGIRSAGSHEQFYANRYSNDRVNEAMNLFYELSAERDHVGQHAIPTKIKNRDIDYLIEKGVTNDKHHIISLIKYIDSLWLERKNQELTR